MTEMVCSALTLHVSKPAFGMYPGWLSAASRKVCGCVEPEVWTDGTNGRRADDVSSEGRASGDRPPIMLVIPASSRRPERALVARSDLVKALFTSYRKGDDRGFRSSAEALIEDERRKRHDLLASELEAILGEPRPWSRPLQVSALRPLPKGRDELELLEMLQPSASLQQVVLAPELGRVVEGL